MAIFGLDTHKIVEVNKLHGLLSGHMVAQAPFPTSEDYLDNGAILFLDEAAQLVLGDDAEARLAQPFLHYTEELMAGPVAGYEYFTVEAVDGVCYPRAIALYEGDEFTTNNVATDLAEYTWAAKNWAVLVDGELTLTDDLTDPHDAGPIFAAFKDTLPAGQKAVRLVLIAKTADAVAE